jgi:hypothetical protein
MAIIHVSNHGTQVDVVALGKVEVRTIFNGDQIRVASSSVQRQTGLTIREAGEAGAVHMDIQPITSGFYMEISDAALAAITEISADAEADGDDVAVETTSGDAAAAQGANTRWQKHVAYCAMHHEGDTDMPSPYANL